MKKFKILLLTVLATSLVAGSVMALPLLGDLKDDQGNILWEGYTNPDTGAGLVSLLDTDGNQDTAAATLYIAIGSYFKNSQLSFGMYDLAGNEKLLFDTTIGVDEGQSIRFDAPNDLASLDNGGSWFDMESTFGFYLANTNGNIFYTEESRNDDSFDHALIFDVSGITSGGAALMNSDVIIAFEDLRNGGDEDFNDFVVGISDVAPVPEPATMLLFGMGLLGLAGITRRKKA